MSVQIPSDDITQIRHRTKKEQKVRNSCNACSSQKIRCSKERPKCHRCTIKGLDCVYSMSRRTGERPRVMEANFSAIVSPPTTPIRHDSVAPMNREAPTSRETPGISSTDHFEGVADIQDDISWMLGPNPDHDMPIDSYFDVNMNDFGAGAACSTSTTRNDAADFLNTPPIQEFDLSFNFSTSCTERKQIADLQPKRIESTPAIQTNTAVSPRETKVDLVKARKTLDCASAALALIAEFHVADRDCLTAAKDGATSLDLEYSTFDTHDIETVLSRNREAMKKLNGILDCQCSLNQEILVTVYLAVGKAISWYEGILGDDNSASEDQIHSALMGRITTKPVFMGNYCLDTQAQRIVSAHVVLTQLREHVAPLVKRLVCRHSSAGTDSAMSSRASSSHPTPTSSGIGGLIECHHQILQEQLNRLILRANSIKQS